MTRNDITKSRLVWRAVLFVLEAAIASAAWGGGAGLIADNALNLTAEWVNALPFRSTTLAGIALIVVVAVPATAAAIAETVRSRYAYPLSLVASVALVGWIFAQWAIVREYFVLQPVMLAAGLAVAITAWWVHTRAIPN